MLKYIIVVSYYLNKQTKKQKTNKQQNEKTL